MPREIFVDASAWIAVSHADDNWHAPAVETFPRLFTEYQRLVTTNLVIAEVYISLRQNVGLTTAVGFAERVRLSPRILRILSSDDLETQAEALLRQYDDQDFSYTDAVSFALMRARGIREAFTFAKHFGVMGFQVVPATAR